MRMIGPMRNFWTMRLEGKHRIFTQMADVTCNRLNLCYSLALKHQLCLNEFLCSNRMFNDDINYKIADYVNLFPQFLTTDKFQCVNYIEINNVKYSKDAVLFLKNNHLPIFGKILSLYRKQSLSVKSELSDFAIIMKIYETITYDDHLQLYEIVETNNVELYYLSNVKDLEIYYLYELNAKCYILYNRVH